MSSRDDRLDELYAGSASDFVKRRNALAKELKAEDEAEAAAQVSALKRPSAAAWALNQGVRADAGAAKALAKAGKDLAAAQTGVLEGKRGARERMRKAKADEDDAIERLVGAVVTAARGDRPSAATLERVRETLRAVATNEQVASEVAAGRVVTDRRAVGLGGDLAAALAASPRKGKRDAGARKRKRDAAARKRREPEIASKGPVVVHEAEAEWTGWPAEEAPRRGDASWKTLISGDRTDSTALTFGLAELRPGESLRAHRHAQPEIYFVLKGSGRVTVAGRGEEVRAGAAVFLPGDEVHSIVCTGSGRLRLAYVFAADSAEDVEYVFPEGDE